jgi:hypothetical protein
MKSDVKALRVSTTGAVFTGRTRLRGIILNSNDNSWRNRWIYRTL